MLSKARTKNHVCQAVHGDETENVQLHVSSDVITVRTDRRAFLLQVARLAKIEVFRRPFVKAKMHNYRSVSMKAILSHKTRAEDELSPIKMGPVRSPNSPTSISDDKKSNSRACSSFTYLDDFDIRRHNRVSQERKSIQRHIHRQCCSTIHLARKPASSASGFKVLLAVCRRYQGALKYSFYRVIHKPETYNDDVASELQKIHKNFVIQMKDRSTKTIRS